MNIYIMELHRKFSVPFGAFFFVLLAFAISRAGKTYDQSTGFIVGLFNFSCLLGFFDRRANALP